jgi:murein DD-endopeptidase MepM/ murein hydrolase activator NlpD
MEGTVKTVGHNSTLGNYVKLQKEKYIVTYGHLRSVSVRQGQSVAVGDTIGRVGSTGNVSEPTLHMEFTYNGDLYNPYFYLQNRRVSQENA